MTTINIKKENSIIGDMIFQDMGYSVKRGFWSKKVDLSGIREEIERLQTLNIHSIEIVLD